MDLFHCFTPSSQAFSLKSLSNASECYEDFVVTVDFSSDIKAKGRELGKCENFCGPFEFN